MHQVHGRVAGEGKIPIFFPDVLPPVVSSPASPSSGAGVQLRWAKAWPCHGGCPGEVNVVAGWLQLAGRGGGGPRTPASGSVVAVVVVPEIGGAHELPDAATAMASRSKGLRELSTPSATVVGAKRRRWRSDEVRCGNAGLRWASSSAKVSAVCLSSWRSQSGCQRRLYRDVEDAVVSPWLCSWPWRAGWSCRCSQTARGR